MPAAVVRHSAAAARQEDPAARFQWDPTPHRVNKACRCQAVDLVAHFAAARPPPADLPAPPGAAFRGGPPGGPGGMMPHDATATTACNNMMMRGPPPGAGPGGPLSGLGGPGGQPMGPGGPGGPPPGGMPQMSPQQQQMMQMMVCCRLAWLTTTLKLIQKNFFFFFSFFFSCSSRSEISTQMQQQGVQMSPQQQQMMMMMVMQMTAQAGPMGGGGGGPGGPMMGGGGGGPGGPGGPPMMMGGPGGPGGPGFGGPPRPNSLFITPQMLMSKNPTKWGWMIKQGGGFKSWKRRFFILVNDKLYYFEKDNSKEPKGFILLDRSTAVNNTFVPGKQNCFAIKTGPRDFLVSAESVAEADDWIRVLSETAHGRATTAAAPMKAIAKKKKDLTLARHVLLTKNCAEALKKSRREEVDELVSVANTYLEASAQLAVLGKQLCDALMKVSASTQSYDVGEALKEVAQYQKQLFLQRANENDMLRKGVIQAMSDAGKQDLVDVLGFEKRQKNALKAMDLKLKKEEAIARKLGGRGDVGEQAKGRLMNMVRERDGLRESQLREVLTLERFKYIKLLSFWRQFSELTGDHQREAARTLEDKLPNWRRFDQPDARRTLPPNIEDLIAGRVEEGPAVGASGVTPSGGGGGGQGTMEFGDEDFQKPPPQYGPGDDDDERRRRRRRGGRRAPVSERRRRAATVRRRRRRLWRRGRRRRRRRLGRRRRRRGRGPRLRHRQSGAVQGGGAVGEPGRHRHRA
jgi:hypothetical protein